MTNNEALLRGNGAGLVRERALAARVQAGLSRLYFLDGAPDVRDFLSAAGEGEREVLLVREDAGGLEVALKVPALDGDLDSLCQLIEGVSHYVYLAHRAQGDRSTTALEMELQAEVDKYVVIATSFARLDVQRSATLRARLYADVRFTHDEDTELGERYRVANRVASRFVEGLERRYVARGELVELRTALRRFFHVGQSEKMHLAAAR